MFSCAFYEISKNAYFYRTPLVAVSERSSKQKPVWPSANLPKGGNSWFYYPFKAFSILNFAMVECFFLSNIFLS